MRASEIEIGGDHYKDFPIQPGEFCTKNKLGGLQSSIVGRICRYDKPTGGGLKDLKKIKHEVDLIIEWEGWEEERYWEEKEQQRSEKVDYLKDLEQKTWKTTTRSSGLRRCACGGMPFMNVRRWVECPKCHATGEECLTDAYAQQVWNEGRTNEGRMGKGKVLGEKKQQRSEKVDYIEDIEEEVRRLPTRTLGLRRCNCGSFAPYINAANGLYWVECPYCHTTSGKRLTRAGARQAWEKGEVSIDEKKL